MAEETVVLTPEAYSHSPAHYYIVSGDLLRLNLLLTSLPRLSHPSSILTLSDSLLQSRLAAQISSVIDRRDVPHRNSPLHLAVLLLPLSSAISATSALTLAGADPSLPNSSGWTPIHLALSLNRHSLSTLLLRHHRISAWSKLRRRLPSLLQTLTRIPDFNLHISLRFESPLLPFIPKSSVPADDLHISKRSSDLRADRRRRFSFLFLSSPETLTNLPFGSLLLLDRDRKEIRNAFDSDSDTDSVATDSVAYRPGIDIANARLIPCTNWRRRQRFETVGDWKAKVYELHNVVFSFKTLAAAAVEEEFPELEIDEEAEDGFLVAELPNLAARHSSCERGGFRRGEEAGLGRRRSLDSAAVPEVLGMGSLGFKCKEKEVVKNLKPMVWLTEDFPLKTEELLPMLDILADKIKVVKQIRELLTTKFPPGTFPVKVAIPIFPTVRMIITFTKFVNTQPPEQFFTPLSSPRHLSTPEDEENRRNAEGPTQKSWLKWNSNSAKSSVFRSKTINPQAAEHIDPFAIPGDYKWVGIRDNGHRMRTSRSRKGKQKEAG